MSTDNSRSWWLYARGRGGAGRRVAASVIAASGVVLSLTCVTLADDVTAGVNGINSRTLGLLGTGQYIGQIELGRPGEATDANGEWFWDYGPDGIRGNGDVGENDGVYQNGESWVDLDGDMAYTAGWRNFHPDVVPFQTRVAGAAPSRTPVLSSVAPNGFFRYTEGVYNNNVRSAADPNISRHALQVAGVMISNGANDRGVAGNARLISAGFGGGGAGDNAVILTTQDVIRQQMVGSLSNVRAVNHSWGGGPIVPNGNSQVTQAMDYFAQKYDVLTVTAGDEEQVPASHPGRPSDQYNGINVSSLSDDAGNGTGVFDRYSSFNRYTGPADGRIIVHLCAPGDEVLMPQLGGTGYSRNSGTSFAAPHVTAVSAMLQQYGDARRAANTPRWDGSARTHQVMKAVLLNSADKLKDDGTIVPMGNLLGMEKTIYRDSAGTQTYLTSPAYLNDRIPLDTAIGSGALNANRALKQYQPGEYDEGGQIPLIGWDNGFTFQDAVNTNYWYYFNTPLIANSFVSVTLCWDRLNTLSGADTIFDAGETFSAGLFADLDLFLMKKDANGEYTEIVDRSISSVDTTEQIFKKLDFTGDYAIRMTHTNVQGSFEYGLAWWAVPAPGAGTGMLTLLGIAATRRRRSV